MPTDLTPEQRARWIEARNKWNARGANLMNPAGDPIVDERLQSGIPNFLTALVTGGPGVPGDIGQAAASGVTGLLNAQMQAIDPTGQARAIGGQHGLLQAPQLPFTSDALQQGLGGDPSAPESLLGFIGAPDITDVGKIAGMASKPGGLLLAQSLFHGTPHRFDKFSNEAIGTGEGAQAFGHGLYFAENPGVAKSYQRDLSHAIKIKTPSGGTYDTGTHWFSGIDPQRAKIAEDIQAAGFDVTEGDVNEFVNLVDNLQGDLSKVKDPANYRRLSLGARRVADNVDVSAGGHLYEVEIPDEITERMLDWDAPLSEQPESVQEILRQRKIFSDLELPKNPKGDQIRTEFIVDDLVLTAENDSRLYQDRTVFNAIENYRKDPSRVTSRNVINRKFSDYPYDRDRYSSPLEALESEKGAISVGELYKRTSASISGDDLSSVGDTALLESGQVKLSEELRDAGIPGIRFWDGGSRGAGDGTRNIVVFDPDDITQVKRDGQEVYKKGLADVARPLRGEVDGKLTKDSLRRDISTRAKEKFGLTDNFNEAGYVRSDGEMLDFSGKSDHGDYVREGDRFVLKPEARFDDLRGQRVTDHRDISFVFDGGTDSTTDDMLEFQKRMRNVRVDFGNGVASANFKPTDKQLEVLSDGFFGKDAILEFDHPVTGQTIASAEFESPSKAQIKRFFNEALRKVD